MRRLLLLMFDGVRIRSSGRPVTLEYRKQRRRSDYACQVRIGAALEQQQAKVELPVNRRHQERHSLIARRRLIDVGTTDQQCQGGIHVALPNRMQKWCESTPATHQFSVCRRLRFLVFFVIAGRCIVVDRFAVGVVRDGLRAWVGCVFLARLFFGLGADVAGRIRHVRPLALNLARSFDSRLDLARLRLPVRSATPFCFEFREELCETLLRRPVCFFHIHDIHREGGCSRVGSGLE